MFQVFQSLQQFERGGQLGLADPPTGRQGVLKSDRIMKPERL